MDLQIFHEVMVVFSASASVLGLGILQLDDQMEENQHLLMSMAFGCWLVYCIAWSLLPLTPPELTLWAGCLRGLTGFAQLFTLVSLISLPLHASSVTVE